MVVAFGEVQSNQTTKWRPEPNFRGTYGILSSCLITMTLCVWTAVHLNIPEHNKASQQKWRKLKWLLVGLLAPEIVVFNAYVQRRAAGRICNFMRDLSGQPPILPFYQKVITVVQGFWGNPKTRYEEVEMQTPDDDQKPVRKQHWTLTHGFYVVMGGFSIDISDVKEPFLDRSISRLSLTPSGFRFLARREPGLVPDISEEQIQDKGKANSLAKTVVCFQASWFCIQCIFRLAQKYPICLLELNVFAHAICTLLIYLLWWDKPLDVDEPTLIKGEKVHPICAMMCLTNNKLGDLGRPWAKSYAGDNDQLRVEFSEVQTPMTDELDAATKRRLEPEAGEIYNKADERNRQIRIKDGETHHGIKVDFHGGWVPGYDKPWPAPISGDFHLDLDATHDRLWNLASQGFRNYPISEKRPWRVEWYVRRDDIVKFWYYGPIRTKWPEHKDEDDDALRKRQGNFKLLDYNNDGFGRIHWITLSGLMCASIFYGGLHLLAWAAPFASPSECILWRLSALSIIATGPVVALIIAGISFILIPMPDEVGPFGVLGLLFMSLLSVFVVLLYVFARAYLVVESFINIAHLPEQVYELPDWSQYVPHIV